MKTSKNGNITGNIIGNKIMNILKSEIESKSASVLKHKIESRGIDTFEDKIESEYIKNKETNSLAVVRADDISKVKTTLCDLIRYAHLTFVSKPRKLESTFADNILISVMNSSLRTCCNSAAIVSLNEDASAAIGRLRKIHPPGHVIIVSPRHEIFDDLANYVDILPEIDLDLDRIDIYQEGREEEREEYTAIADV